MKLHKEGTKTILFALIIVIVINILAFNFIPIILLSYFIFITSLVFLFIILWFFRVPERIVINNENYVYAPCDGKVVVIEETIDNEYFNEKRIQISIFMSPLNVHINWYPISGVVKYFKYHKGKYLVAWHPKSSTENERATVVIENDNKKEILVKQIAGALARRIVPYSKTNTTIKQGDQLGFIKFGSRVDVILPLNTEIKVNLNEKVIGNKTVIAKI